MDCHTRIDPIGARSIVQHDDMDIKAAFYESVGRIYHHTLGATPPQMPDDESEFFLFP
jgi:hypothetical protein